MGSAQSILRTIGSAISCQRWQHFGGWALRSTTGGRPPLSAEQSAGPTSPKKPGIISLILVWLGFVGALAIFVEPIGGLFWLAVEICAWRWRKKR